MEQMRRQAQHRLYVHERHGACHRRIPHHCRSRRACAEDVDNLRLERLQSRERLAGDGGQRHVVRDMDGHRLAQQRNRLDEWRLSRLHVQRRLYDRLPVHPHLRDCVQRIRLADFRRNRILRVLPLLRRGCHEARLGHRGQRRRHHGQAAYPQRHGRKR